MAVTIMSNAIPIGSLLASIIPSIVIQDDPSISFDVKRDSIHLYVVVISVGVTVLSLPLIFLARSNPANPPS